MKKLLLALTLVSTSTFTLAYDVYSVKNFVSTLPAEDINVLQDYIKTSDLISTYYGR